MRLTFSLAAVVVFAATSVPAEDAATWLSRLGGKGMTQMQAGQWHPQGGKLFTTDPLTLLQTVGRPIDVPDAPARIFGLLEPEQGRGALMALIWSDADVECGEYLTVIGVDTGLAGFMTPADAAALAAYGEKHGNIYAEQLDAAVPTVPFIAEPPDGARFVVSGSGWGDGGYPVASLHDANGDIVALYAQFIPDGDDCLLPEPCGNDNS